MMNATKNTANTIGRILRMLAWVSVAGTVPTAKADFSGDYAPANWTVTYGPLGYTGYPPDPLPLDPPAYQNGWIDTSGAPSRIDLHQQTTEFYAESWGGNVFCTIAVTASGTWSFHWDTLSSDPGWDAYFVHFGWCLNPGNLNAYGNPAWNSWATELSTFAAYVPHESGDVLLPVSAGDVIGFWARTDDNWDETGYLSISDFVAPTNNLTAIPEPGNWMALGCLIGSGVFLRSRRRVA